MTTTATATAITRPTIDMGIEALNCDFKTHYELWVYVWEVMKSFGFGVKEDPIMPKIMPIDSTRPNGWYQPRYNIVGISPYAPLTVLAHEFAHALQPLQGGASYYKDGRIDVSLWAKDKYEQEALAVEAVVRYPFAYSLIGVVSHTTLPEWCEYITGDKPLKPERVPRRVRLAINSIRRELGTL